MCLVLLWSLVHLFQGCRAAPGGQSCERRMDAEWQGVATALSAPGAMGGAAVHAVGAWSEPRTSLGVGAPSDTAAPWPCAAHPGCGGCWGTRGHGAQPRLCRRAWLNADRLPGDGTALALFWVLLQNSW